MWFAIVTISSLIAIIVGQEELPGGPVGIYRQASEGVRSLGYSMVYGDEDIADLNKVIDDIEKRNAKLKFKINETLQPLPSIDVKCLMSVDKYCTKEMAVTKRIMIEVVKNDCADCTDDQKELAGRVMAAMLTHNPVAWKYFLNRCALLIKKPNKEGRRFFENVKIKPIGKPIEIMRPHDSSYIMPGVNVKVIGYNSEIVY